MVGGRWRRNLPPESGNASRLILSTGLPDAASTVDIHIE
jgi:hypothetical protein